MVVLVFSTTIASQALAQGQISVGVDADPTGNSATSLGTVEVCRRVEAGDTLQVDIFVRDAEKVDGFQADLSYDPAVLKVKAVDITSDETFLGSGESGPVTDFTTFDDPQVGEDTDGIITLAAADFGDAENGEGVVARIILEALSPGQSPLTLSGIIVTTPHPSGSKPIATDEEGHFAGPVQNAVIAVGQDCTQAPPPAPTQPAASADSDEGGGLGAAGWAAIGGGIAAAALLLAGAAFVWNRRRS